LRSRVSSEKQNKACLQDALLNRCRPHFFVPRHIESQGLVITTNIGLGLKPFLYSFKQIELSARL
jgi:hypothetical protein